MRKFFSSDLLLVLILLFVSLVTFHNSFDNAFLMDDFPMLVENNAIGNPDFLQLDASAHAQMYFRPVTHVLNLVTFMFFQKEPFGYHLVNLLFLYGAALVFYFLLKKVFASPWLAFWAAVLFLMHPINGVCVNYKNATGDSFFVFAMNLALLRGVLAAQEKDWQNHILGLIWLLAALFCHEIAFAFPLYLAALLYSTGKYSWPKIFRVCTPSVIVLSLYLLFRLQFASLKSSTQAVFSSTWDHLANFSQIIFWYISKLFFLNDIVLIWDAPPLGNNALLWVSLFFISAGILISLIIFFRTKNPPVSLGLLWLAIGFIPVFFASFSRPWFGVIVEPFWLIFSSLGFFLIAVGIGASFYEKHSTLVNVGMALYCSLVLLPATWRYNDLWSQPVRYCQYWMKVSPRNFFPQFWLSYSLMKEKQYAQAKTLLEDLLGRGIRYEWTYGNLGIAEYHLGNYEEARTNLLKALTFNPNNGDTHYHLGMVFGALHDFPRARLAFQRATELAPEIIDAKTQLEAVNPRKQFDF